MKSLFYIVLNSSKNLEIVRGKGRAKKAGKIISWTDTEEHAKDEVVYFLQHGLPED